MTQAAAVTSCPSSDLDPFSDEFLADPFPSLTEVRALGPVVFLERYGVFMVANHAEVQAVLRDHHRFSSAAGTGLANVVNEPSWRKPSILLEVDPPVHTRNRAVVARAVSPKLLKTLQETFDERAGQLADALVALGSFDAVTDLAEIFPTRVFPDAFGLRDEGREHLLAYGALVFNGTGPPNERFQRSFEHADEVIGWITAQCRRDALRPDGLGALIYLGVDAGEVSEEEAALLVRSFLSAGIDTTVNALALGVLAFIRFPDQWALLRRDRGLAKNAFEEIVRRESPVIGFFRTTNQEVSLAGVIIPADTKVLVSFAGANRDPARWEHPDEFDITRRVVGHAGFGVGIHNCVGQVIARMEGESILAALADRIGSLELAGEPFARLNNTLRGLETLPVRVTAA